MEAQRTCAQCGQSYAADVLFCPKDGAPLAARKTEVVDDPYLGLTVFGQFRIQQLIGIGAMGRVYRAHQTGIERDVAIKILHREFLRNRAVVARFHREAKVASRLVHPNVVQVLMTGELERQAGDIGGEAYLVMEYLDGISLRSALAAAGGALSMPRAFHIVLQVCDAVGEGHAHGVVHRDLKPENVMLVRRGDDRDFVKVLDFGVARLEGTESTVATQAGVILGTARYISPEGAQGNPVTPAGDVYSIATLLFQCLAGETPFDGDNPVKILVKHTSQNPPDIRSIGRASYVPEPIARVIAANLAKNPADRCRDAREFGRALVQAARDSGLEPNDLAHSTLLGAQALQLASLERTRSLGLNDQLAARLAGKTELTDPAGNRHTPPPTPGPPVVITTLTPEPARGRTSSPQLAPSLDPTLTDSDVLAPPPRTASPANSAPTSTSASATEVPEAKRSWDDASEPKSDKLPLTRMRPKAALVSFFALGAVLALVSALKLGVFRRPEPTLEDYVQRAHRAMQANAWDQPASENFKSITEAALRRWPKADGIRAARKEAARTLVSRSSAIAKEEPANALRFARLAAEFDPESPAARDLLDRLSAPPPANPAPPSIASSAPLPAAVPRSKAAPRRTAPPTSSAPKTPPEPAQPPDPPAPEDPKPENGRWL